MNENENELTADEIVTYFLKTGEIPEELTIIKVPTEKVTVLKNEYHEIDFRDLMDIISKADFINPWKKLNPEQLEVITCNIPNFNIMFSYLSLIYTFFFPDKFISIFKRKDVQKAVFDDHNPESIYFMKQVAQFYVHLLDTENKNNLTPKEKDDAYKRTMTYLRSQKDFLGDDPTSIYFMKQIALFHVNLLGTENKNNFPQKDDYYKRRMTFLRSEKKFLDDLLKRLDEIPQQSEKPKPELNKALILFTNTEIINKLHNELKGYFPNKEAELLKALQGNQLDSPLLFPHNQNKFVEVFKRLKYNKHLLSTPKEIGNWICSNFTYIRTQGDKKEVQNFNKSTIKTILTNTVKERQVEPTPKERICTPDWLPHYWSNELKNKQN